MIMGLREGLGYRRALLIVYSTWRELWCDTPRLVEGFQVPGETRKGQYLRLANYMNLKTGIQATGGAEVADKEELETMEPRNECRRH